MGLRDWGGREEAGPIVLLHGLMGRGRTWRRQIPWLRRYGRVFTFDAEFHRGPGFPVPVPEEDIATERFVADVAEILVHLDQGPATLIGHSMGGLHAWCTAAEYPELVRAIVVEDMSPEFTGQSTDTWSPWFASWPARFGSQAACEELFGPVAGRYFYEAFDDGALHGDLDTFRRIADHWGPRDHWAQWRAVQAPTLLLEAEFTVVPPGIGTRMVGEYTGPDLRYFKVDGAGHLVHDDAPIVYRGAVEAFLSGLDDRPEHG
ncbi:alpha/beta fold hydrolase [Tsukamurella pseudospumae]|uniref:alpha/beta fold hydrolase n=1 Tax=Tsukamurella pseudospumae TaxID=239498 RepID=UPI001FD48D8D|nr:alpha/beta hydrolase [Tsukamurella pseudospumae]